MSGLEKEEISKLDESTNRTQPSSALPLRYLVILILCSVPLVVFDVSMPLGVAGGVPFVILVLISLWMPRQSLTISAAALGSLLTIAGFLLSSSGADLWFVVTNRLIALSVIWLTTVLCLSQKRNTRERFAALAEMARMQDRQSSYGAILDRSLNEIFIFDAKSFQFVHANHGARENLGYSMDELRKMTPLDIKPDHTTSTFAQLVEPLLNGTEVGIRFTTAHLRKDGSMYPVEVNLQCGSYDNRPVFVAVILDITERQLTEKNLRDSRKQALEADRSKSEFLANMSHEIRTPMTAILGFSDILLGNMTNPDNIETAHTIKKNGEFLLELINDILDLSKVEAGKLEVEQIDCSPHTILSEVVSLMRVRSNAKGLSLEVHIDGSIPETISSDPDRLRQILINVVGNAIKFTETGSVQIVTRLLDQSSGEPKLQFDVIDTGIGIARDKIDKLFSPFMQADNSTTRQYGGTGLGLSISKRLAENLGGEISVSSTPGKGCTFSITVGTGSLDGVRMIGNTVEMVLKTVNVVETSGTGEMLFNSRILLAEDGPDNQRLIAYILKKAGAEIEIADNGKVAVDLAIAAKKDGSPFDAILMDMQMPLLDGYAATRQLRDAGHDTPIIALTAHAMTSDRQKCLDAGCDEYATKPIDKKKLVELLASYLRATPSAGRTAVPEECASDA